MLGLPKPKAALAMSGKIVIPGGRYQGGGQVGVSPGEGEGEGEKEEEWKTNGAGRVDVRGFRELKI
jgi:OTU domain-containing protein 3